MARTAWEKKKSLAGLVGERFIHPLLSDFKVEAGRIVTSSLLATGYPMNMSPFPTPVGTSDEHRQAISSQAATDLQDTGSPGQIPEVLRIRIEVRYSVGLVRGEQYVRLQPHER